MKLFQKGQDFFQGNHYIIVTVFRNYPLLHYKYLEMTKKIHMQLYILKDTKSYLSLRSGVETTYFQEQLQVLIEVSKWFQQIKKSLVFLSLSSITVRQPNNNGNTR